MTTGLALILAAVAGWLFLSAAPAAPLAQADTAGKASDTGLQRDTVAANHAVSEAFPPIEQIGGSGPIRSTSTTRAWRSTSLSPVIRPAPRASRSATRCATSY